MRSSDIKNKKKEQEVFEEVDDSVFGTDTYESSFTVFVNKLADKYNNFKSKKYFLPVTIISGVLIFTLIVYLGFLIGNSGNKNNTTITSIDFKVPSVVYVDDEATVKVNLYGKGKLSSTKLTFVSQSPEVADFTIKEATGDYFTNSLKVLSEGTFYVTLNTETVNGSKKSVTSDNIIVCKKLTKELVGYDNITLDKGKTFNIDINNGKVSKCKKQLKYKIEDESIVGFTSSGKLIGISVGQTKLTVTEGASKVVIDVVVR